MSIRNYGLNTKLLEMGVAQEDIPVPMLYNMYTRTIAQMTSEAVKDILMRELNNFPGVFMTYKIVLSITNAYIRTTLIMKDRTILEFSKHYYRADKTTGEVLHNYLHNMLAELQYYEDIKI